MKTLGFWVLGTLIVLCGSAHAQAAYQLLTQAPGGELTQTLSPGDTFVLQCQLESSGSDVATSVVFDLQFSKPGLKLTGYTWGGTFAGSSFDNSQPAGASLPAIITASTVGNAASPVDAHFENFATAPFSTGTLLTLNFEVPSDFTPAPGTITITPVPDTIANDLGNVPTTAGSSFTVNVVVPEPAILPLIGLFGLLLRRRGR